MKNLAWLKGFAYGIFLSGVIPLIFMLIAQTLGGGVTSIWGESWFYFALLIPFVLTSSILSHVLYHKKEITNKNKWLISLISTIFISLFTGTIGAIFGEYVVRGNIETIVIKDTLLWGTIYSFLFLPLSVPLMRVNIELIKYIVKK